tara:strand:+ start:1208 stop:1741 length:534 start_codon:yes stop_codon:yes gene_type:complete
MMEIESSLDRNKEWSQSVQLMQGLFPKWQTSNEQLASWKEKFGMLNPEWFREALHLTYHTYNSDSPKPKWVAESFKQIKAGHQGIPLNESDSACVARNKSLQEQEQYDSQIRLERIDARKNIMSWDSKDIVKWHKMFTDKFAMFKTKGNPNDVSTWSDSLIQQVIVYRKLVTEKKLR